jgi:hypothetical protein
LIVDPLTEWDVIVERGVKDWKGKGLKAVLIKLYLGASVYNLWWERNNSRNGNHLQIEEKLIQKISWVVRMKIISNGGFLRSRENEELCCSWGLSDRLFGGR